MWVAMMKEAAELARQIGSDDGSSSDGDEAPEKSAPSADTIAIPACSS